MNDGLMQVRPEYEIWDRGIVADVYHGNCYRLGDWVRGTLVIDVGAHIGSFSCLALDMGASLAIAFEPQADNFRMLASNLSRFSQSRYHAVNAAMWRSDQPGVPLWIEEFKPNDPNSNTGGSHVSPPGSRFDSQVSSVCLDAILSELAGPVEVLKLDCEGSEFPILYTSMLLRRMCRRVVMEYHRGAPLWHPVEEASPESMIRYLMMLGYHVESVAATENLGLIFATSP